MSECVSECSPTHMRVLSVPPRFPSMQNVVPTVALSPEGDADEESPVAPQEKIINISYELAAEASKRSKLVAGERGRERAVERERQSCISREDSRQTP